MRAESPRQPASVDLRTLARSCSECAMCRCACPAAETLQREISAPRSWALVARHVLEGKSALTGRAGEPDECTGCERCVDFCYAHYPLPTLVAAAVGDARSTLTVTLEGAWYLGLVVEHPRSGHGRERRLELPPSRVRNTRVQIVGSARIDVDPLLSRAVAAGTGVTVGLDSSWRARAAAAEGSGLLRLRCCFEALGTACAEGEWPLAEDALGGLWCCGAAAPSPSASAEMARNFLQHARTAGFRAVIATSEACASHLAGSPIEGISVL